MVLVADVAELLRQVLGEFGLKWRARCEVGVAALGGEGPVVRAVPDQPGLAQSRPRRDSGPRSRPLRLLRGREWRSPPAAMQAGRGAGFQVVEQGDGDTSECLGQAGSIDDPGGYRA